MHFMTACLERMGVPGEGASILVTKTAGQTWDRYQPTTEVVTCGFSNDRYPYPLGYPNFYTFSSIETRVFC